MHAESHVMDLSQTPFISVIVATFHRTGYLERCLKRIFSNNYDNYEIIIVDQGKDDTIRDLIIRQFMGGEDKIKYLHSETVGLSHTRNLGVRNANGEIVVN